MLQAVVVAVLCVLASEAQSNRRQGARGRGRQGQRQTRQNNQFGRNGVTRNGAKDAKGTEVYPGCSGKVCLPEAQLCAERKRKVSSEGTKAAIMCLVVKI